MISFKRQAGLCAALALTAGTCLAFSKADDATPPVGMMPVADFPKDYKGTPFTDSKYKDGAQKIPGKVMCAYYDLGGEGIAYHDTDAKNKGSGGLNPLDGKYLNEFRAEEGVDTSYTKDFADFWEGEAVKPPKDMLYVGWTEPGEWVNYTVDVAEDGDYSIDILYTSNRGGELSLDVNGNPLDKPITIASTNDPKDTTSWRQWHHWNLNQDAATVKLSKGRNLLTLHVVEKGNMNLGILDFKLVKLAMVTAAFKDPGGDWKDYPTRTLADLPSAIREKKDSDLDPYGGQLPVTSQATGFFHTMKRDGRWWLVDPTGALCIYKGIASVSPLRAAGATAAFQSKFGSKTNWAAKTTDLLRENGFMSAGAWSDTDALRSTPTPLAYTRVLNLMNGYGHKRGGTYSQPGHTGYPKDCVFVFDPEFESFCDEDARALAENKNDPKLIGYFSDNELPFSPAALSNYLALPEKDPGHEAALAWLRARHGEEAGEKDIVAQDKPDFLEFVVDRYFRITSSAIRKYDPNHLFLGSRFYGSNLSQPEMFRAAGHWLDVISVNWYHAWTPDPERMAMWERESGKPILITEWYAKGMDSGLGNRSGAGWVVKTQGDRGLFYQNFTLGLLESKVCVGWDWFKYADNDPEDTGTDPSNRDSNKGILSNRYEPYGPLLDSMKQINERTFSVVKFFDQNGQTKTEASSTATATPAAGVPQIDFVPPALNTDDPISGKVKGIDNPTDYKVVLLLSRDQKIWWDKTHNVHGITIQPDGTFTVKGWSNFPQTLTTPFMGVWLVPQSFDTHAPNFQVEGVAVPENLTAAAVAMKIKSREPSEQAKSDASTPDAGKPDASKSDATKSEASTTEVSKPEVTATPAAIGDAPVLGKGAIPGAVLDIEVPVLGSDAPITGELSGVPNPADYKGVVLVSRDQKVWWNKTHNGSGIAIQPDGTFTAKGWATPARTLTTPYVGVWLFPQSFDLHAPNFSVEGTAVPEKVTDAAVAMKIKSREPSKQAKPDANKP